MWEAILDKEIKKNQSFVDFPSSPDDVFVRNKVVSVLFINQFEMKGSKEVTIQVCFKILPVRHSMLLLRSGPILTKIR